MRVDASGSQGEKMKYRAIAVGLRLKERPVQIYGGDVNVMREWARSIAEQHDVNVEILVTMETLLETIEPRKEEGE